jgi:hypothetical protein
VLQGYTVARLGEQEIGGGRVGGRFDLEPKTAEETFWLTENFQLPVGNETLKSDCDPALQSAYFQSTPSVREDQRQK